jgi:hypothetical protein
MKDAFDQWWEWANKPFSDMAPIPAEIHEAVMAFLSIAAIAPRSTKPCGSINAARRSERAKPYAQWRPSKHSRRSLDGPHRARRGLRT